MEMFQKIHADFLEDTGTRRGSVLSAVAACAMGLLFFLETKAFLASAIQTNLRLDSNPEEHLRVNFNITMLDLACEYATIDVVSVLGTQQDVTQHLTKTPIDDAGEARRPVHKPLKKQHEVVAQYDTTIEETIEELHEDGVDAVELDGGSLNKALGENTFVFVDFFAEWCSHCQDLAPTWETLAEVVNEAAASRDEQREHRQRHNYTEKEYKAAVAVKYPVLVAKVDCGVHPGVCGLHKIVAYPTLKFFVDGVEKGDYEGHRTVLEMTHFIDERETEYHGKASSIKSAVRKLDAMQRTLKTQEHADTARKHRKVRPLIQHSWDSEDHPGCQLSGFLLIDRAPGHFHIQARSRSHNLDPLLTNVSHTIHHLSFGKPMSPAFQGRGLNHVPPHFLESTRPFDGREYVNYNEHEAYHHHLKVATTEFDADEAAPKVYNRDTQKWEAKEEMTRAYRILQSSLLSEFERDVVPEAKFSYDFAPMAVSYERTGRTWYDYLTSVMAIVGGTFTVVGMVESGLAGVASQQRRARDRRY